MAGRCGEMIRIVSTSAAANDADNLVKAAFVFSNKRECSRPIDGSKSGGWGTMAANTSDMIKY